MNKEELIIYAIRTSDTIKEEKKQDLIDYVINLQQENQKQKEVINNIKKYFDKGGFEDCCDCLRIKEYIESYLNEVSE